MPNLLKRKKEIIPEIILEGKNQWNKSSTRKCIYLHLSLDDMSDILLYLL